VFVYLTLGFLIELPSSMNVTLWRVGRGHTNGEIVCARVCVCVLYSRVFTKSPSSMNVTLWGLEGGHIHGEILYACASACVKGVCVFMYA